MKVKPVKIQEVQTSCPSGRFPLDALLRQHGFAILSRPKRGPNLWRRRERRRLGRTEIVDHVDYTEAEAVAQLPADTVEKIIGLPRLAG